MVVHIIARHLRYLLDWTGCLSEHYIFLQFVQILCMNVKYLEDLRNSIMKHLIYELDVRCWWRSEPILYNFSIIPYCCQEFNLISRYVIDLPTFLVQRHHRFRISHNQYIEATKGIDRLWRFFDESCHKTWSLYVLSFISISLSVQFTIVQYNTMIHFTILGYLPLNTFEYKR